MAIAIIGDVHGCLVELEDLLEKIDSSLSEGLHGLEEIIFVGDLLDKGPQSVEVLRYVKNLSDRVKVSIVEGNHENRNFRFWDKVEAGYLVKAMETRGSEELMEIMGSADRELRLWLRNKTVPYILKPELGVSILHGGVTPSIEGLPEDPSSLRGRNKKRVLRTMYIRYVTPKGGMVPFNQEGPEDSYWADIYKGRFGHIIFGHQAWIQDKPKCFPHATGIDLGCVYGGYLCALIMKEGDTKIVTVEAREKYWQDLK
tara:strand:+ start:691 stop:1461 length:771 start_codon:yes stop_codon:yes gene_type:complete